MTLRVRPITVKQLPESLNGRSGRAFLREMEPYLDVERPRIVLDCSRVGDFDRDALHAVLCCLEEALKRNGDVRLASLSANGRQVLARAGARHLFEVFETASEAEASFIRRSGHTAPYFATTGAARLSEHAA